MKTILFYLLLAMLFLSCNQNPDPEKIIRDYYKKREAVNGGGRLLLSDVKILTTSKNSDTLLATAVIEGTYQSNQVPNAPPDYDVKDTVYWKFYKKNGKWDFNYHYKPF